MNRYQKVVAGWLSDWGFQWVEEFPAGQYSIDLALPEMALGLEIDGPSHGLSRKKDGLRDGWILANTGYRIIRVPVGTKRADVLSMIENCPVL